MNTRCILARALCVALIVAMAPTNTVLGWETQIDGDAPEDSFSFGSGRAVALDPAGDVFAGGDLSNDSGGNDFTLLRLDRASGLPVWMTRVNGSGDLSSPHALVDLALDDNGDLLAVGYWTNTYGDLAVAKFDGDTGAELWRRSFRGTDMVSPDQNFGSQIAVDSIGNAIAVGTVQNLLTSKEFTVVKLDGETGVTLWYVELDGGSGDLDFGIRVTVTADDDVLASGYMSTPLGERDFAVVRLDGATGAVQWQRTLDGAEPGTSEFDAATAVVEDADGNVIAGGRLENEGDIEGVDFTVLKFNGSTGATVWSTTVLGSYSGSNAGDSFESVSALRPTADGDVLAVGEVLSGENDLDLITVRLDGATGAEIWRHTAAGTAGLADHANAFALDSAGNPIITGLLLEAGTLWDLVTLKVDADSGEELWRVVTDGGYAEFDQGIDIAVGSGDAPVVVGQFTTEPIDDFFNNRDFVVLKYSGVSGADFVDDDGDGLADDDVGFIADAVLDLPVGVFANNGDPEGQRNAMNNRLTEIEASITAGELEEALRQLRNLRRHVDGCEDGPPADMNDWISDCDVQEDIRNLLDAMIASLETLLA